MRLNCNKCHHAWDEDLSGSAAMVQCPECYAVVPLVLAGGSKSSAPTRPAAPAPSSDDDSGVIDAMSTNPIMDSLKTPPAPARRNAQADEDFDQVDFHELPTIRELPKVDDKLITRTAAPPERERPTPERPKLSDHFGGAQGNLNPTDRTVTNVRRATPAEPRDLTFATEDEFGDTETGIDEPKPVHDRPSVHTKTFASSSPKDVDLTGQTVGGYEVKRMLGAGGMGAVCLARQKSLDRDVALKILPGKFAQNPDFLVRFTREALSAAQLTHHNVIQVYDVGSDSDVHYISMEFVRGDSLADMVRRDGPLNPEDAAGYVLQAARGLKYAHERGIIHRDIKPDNLMLNEHGIVKVADMGLAKMRGQDEKKVAQDTTLLAKARGDLTMAEVAMGTPAYMPPEQARDATNVDPRADQYSLGCTLYYLCAGKPPYSGSTAMEIISQHMDAPLPSLEETKRSVPGALNTVLARMLAKDADGRYATMGELIEDLEDVLGIDESKGPYTPREQHLKQLESAQAEYYSAPQARLRKFATLGFFAITPLLFAVSAISKSFGLASFFLGLLILTPFANFVTDGLFHKTYLFRRVRNVFFGMPLTSWLMTAVAMAFGIAVLYAIGMLPWWIAAAVVAGGLAAVYQGFLLAKLRAQRDPSLGHIRDMLKHLRLRGLSEDAVQSFVCRFSDEQWEEMFEDLFGYEDMIIARSKWTAADRLKPRKRFATWRDPVARWLVGVEQERQAARDRRQLSKVEAKRLKSQGVTEKEAQKKADAAADKMLADIKVASKIADVTSAPKKHREYQLQQKNLVDLALQIARFVIGAAGLLYFVGFNFGHRLPSAALSVLNLILNAPIPKSVADVAGTWLGGAASLALLLSAFTWRRFASALVLAGAALVLASKYVFPLIDGRVPMLTEGTFVIGALALAGVGLLICFAGKLGRKGF